MSLSLNNIIIILIGAGAVIAILAIVFFVVYAQRKIDRRKRFAALPTRDAFEPEKVDFESGQPERQAESQDWPRHSRTLSDSSDTPLMRTSPHQWTPSPTLPAFTATPYRDAPPARRSPPSRLQELQPVSLVAVGDSARIPLHKKTRSISPELPIHDVDAQMTIPSQPLPASTVPLKINKARRVGSMRTTLLTHLASVRYEQKKPAEDGGDTSPKSIYSQSSFAYSTRRGSRPASVNEEVRPHIAATPIQLQGVESTAGSHEARKTSETEEQPRLRDSAVFQLPPVISPRTSHSFDEVSLSSGAPLKVSAVEESSPVTLYAEPPAESPSEEVQWRSLRSKLLNTIQDHVVVSENGTPMYESVSRYPSLKY